MIDALTIRVSIMTDPTNLQAQAIASYNALPIGEVGSRRRGRRPASAQDSAEFLDRIVEGHIRHRLSNYDELLETVRETVRGRGCSVQVHIYATALLRWRVMKIARAAYPGLAP